MVRRAKTKNLITLLSGALVAVFACIIGFTFSGVSFTNIYNTNPQPTAYAANQQLEVVNDTLTTPIPFGNSSQGYNISIQYAVDYDFDLRLAYTLTWSGGSSTDNVILTFANRDDYIVSYSTHYIKKTSDNIITYELVTEYTETYPENVYRVSETHVETKPEDWLTDYSNYYLFDGYSFVQVKEKPQETDAFPSNVYTISVTSVPTKPKDWASGFIYKASSISAGTGKLNIITGVEFVDVNDATYLGQTLTINVTAEMYKADQKAYDSDHPLAIEDYTASDTWLMYRSGTSITGAYVMMYNYHYDYDHGIEYPNPRGAYVKDVTASGTVTISNPDWLGGNRAYGGVGAYIITGNSSVYLTARVTGIWRNPSVDAQESNTPDLAYENNIKFNYATDLTKRWSHSSWDETTKLFETRNYSHYIPANTTCYIEIIDSIEITSVSMPSADYSGYRLVTNSIQLNGSSFTGKLSTGTISTGTANSNTAYTNTISVVNTSTYSNILTDIVNSESYQDFETNVTFINNTASPYTLSSIGLGLNYRVSNGLNGFDYDTNASTVTRPEETSESANNLFNDANGRGANYTITGDMFDYLDENTPADTLVKKLTNTTYVLAPYSSVTVISSFKVPGYIIKKVTKDLVGDNNTTKEYDLWLEVNPSVNAEVASNISADISVEAVQSGSTVVFYAKNNTNTTLSIGSMIVNAYSYSYSFDTVNDKPSDWDYAYWKYFETANINNPVTNPEKTWNQTTVYSLSKSTSTLLNNVTISNKTLQPNEMIKIAEANGSIGQGVSIQLVSVTGSSSAPSTPMLINAGTANAMIVNFDSTNSYYVRFSGTYAGTDTTNIQTSNDGYNYYIGVLRPGQILSVPMSETGTIDAEQYVPATAYTETETISSWDTSLFENYFK